MDIEKVMYMLMVSDLDRAVDFYTGTIGFSKRSVSPYWKEDLRGRRPSRDQSFTGTVDESVRSALLADPEGNVFAVVESTA